MTNILFYYPGLTNPDISLGGSSRAVFNFAKSIAGTFTTVVTSERIAREETTEQVKFMPLPPAEIRQKFLEVFDVVIFSQHFGELAGLAKASGQKWILDLHCWDIEGPESARLNSFDHIIARSELHKNHLTSKGLPAEKMTVVPNIIDSTHFYPRETIRDPNSIMFAGAVVPHKGVHILMQSYMDLKVNRRSLNLHIYGSAALWHADDGYEKQLAALNLPDVYFHGPRSYEDMPEVYSSHSILCLPSDLESFGMVTVEAQACGCIPVVHKVGGTPATLIDNETGFLYSPNTHELLSSAIESALQQSAHIRDNAVKFACKNFSSANSYRLLAELI